MIKVASLASLYPQQRFDVADAVSDASMIAISLGKAYSAALIVLCVLVQEIELNSTLSEVGKALK